MPLRNKLLEKMKLDTNGALIRSLRTIGVFLLVDFCWIFFVASSIEDAGLAISKIFTDWSGNTMSQLISMGATRLFLAYSIIAVAVCLIIENIKYIKTSPNIVFSKEWARIVVYSILLLAVIGTWIYLQSSSVESSFIYFEF